MPTLVVKYKDGSRSHPLRDGVPVFIGRAKECDVHLPSPAVSRRHAVVIFKNGICGVKDLGSFNGTIVNGRALEPASARHLTDADVVQISSFIIRLDASDVAARQADPRPGRKGTTVILPHDRGAPPPADGDPAGGTIVDDARAAKPLRRDSGTFPNSHILLPRAMNAPSAAAEELPPAFFGVSPDSTEEVALPADFARSLAREAQKAVEAIMPPPPPPPPPPEPEPAPGESCAVFDTAYFRGEAEAGAPAERPAPAEPSDAERIIPMNDPERAPQLTLDWDDDETNRALEALVAAVSQDVSAYRSARTGTGEAAPVAAPAEDSGPAAAPPPAAPDPAPPETAEWDTDAAIEPVAAAEPEPESGPDSLPSVEDGEYFTGKTRIPGVEALVVPPSLMAAINARLSLHALLSDLAEERKLLRMAQPGLPSEVAAELDRQDAELNSLPSAEEADRLLDALDSRRARSPAEGAMERAEEMAEAQWRLVRDSNRETLPAVYKEAYKLGADEPLSQALSAARIGHGRLVGGAVYLLALEGIAEAARAERRETVVRMRRLADKGLEEDADAGILGKLGRIGDTVNKVRNRAEIREKTRILEESGRESAVVVERAARESAFMEKTLIREFQQVFAQAAAHFVRGAGEMPVAVRAFLRYGAIGFKPWWMRPESREFILRDCRENVVPSIEAGPGATPVLYADEYLAAVAAMECSPLPDESLAGREKDSREWRTERAFRRIVNARSYNVLMDDMLSRLDERLRGYDAKSADIDGRVAELKARPPLNAADRLFGLETEREVISIRRTNLQKHIKRIETEVVASILEAVEESEGRFRRGELAMPDAEALLAREAESLADLARRLGGARPRFMPLAVREELEPGAMNDRESVAARLRDIERADPGVFVSTVIPAKKKENRVELRLGPVAVIVPCSGTRGLCALPREDMEGGHLAVPLCFAGKVVPETAFAGLVADFRWETSRMLGGRDIMTSDTLAGAFMRFRWEWRNEPKARREKGFIFSDLSDKRNWRRVYAVFLSDALHSTHRLPDRNFALFEKVIAPYF